VLGTRIGSGFGADDGAEPAALAALATIRS
jgi:hypothetical protein